MNRKLLPVWFLVSFCMADNLDLYNVVPSNDIGTIMLVPKNPSFFCQKTIIMSIDEALQEGLSQAHIPLVREALKKYAINGKSAFLEKLLLVQWVEWERSQFGLEAIVWSSSIIGMLTFGAFLETSFTVIDSVKKMRFALPVIALFAGLMFIAHKMRETKFIACMKMLLLDDAILVYDKEAARAMCKVLYKKLPKEDHVFLDKKLRELS